MLLKLILIFMFSVSTYASELKLLSWNTYMLPPPLHMSHQYPRQDAIVEKLKNTDYDMVFLQEAFMTSFRYKLAHRANAHYKYQKYLANRRFMFSLLGSGVYVMSRHPFTVLDHVYYKKCASADCFATKGAILIESVIGKKTYQFVVTHMQAIEGKGKIRVAQYHQMDELLKKHKRDGVPQILIGDLNTDSTEPEFQKGQDILGMAHMPLLGDLDHTNVIDCYSPATEPKVWIDHMWVDNQTKLKKGSLKALPFEYEYKGNVCNASDHYAVEGNFQFN